MICFTLQSIYKEVGDDFWKESNRIDCITGVQTSLYQSYFRLLTSIFRFSLKIHFCLRCWLIMIKNVLSKNLEIFTRLFCFCSLKSEIGKLRERHVSKLLPKFLSKPSKVCLSISKSKEKIKVRFKKQQITKKKRKWILF